MCRPALLFRTAFLLLLLAQRLGRSMANPCRAGPKRGWEALQLATHLEVGADKHAHMN